MVFLIPKKSEAEAKTIGNPMMELDQALKRQCSVGISEDRPTI
jgi:hypothetical protein